MMFLRVTSVTLEIVIGLTYFCKFVIHGMCSDRFPGEILAESHFQPSAEKLEMCSGHRQNIRVRYCRAIANIPQ